MQTIKFAKARLARFRQEDVVSYEGCRMGTIRAGVRKVDTK